MGTRNLTIVKYKGKIKVAQYCQWDGYPRGQGATISAFLREKKLVDALKANISKVTFIGENQIEALWEKCGAKNGMASMDVSDKFKSKYPELHRDTGADILRLIALGKAKELHNEYDFLKDGLFCEYAYELDLDKKTVTIYTNGKKYKKVTFKEFSHPDFPSKLEQEINNEN